MSIGTHQQLMENKGFYYELVRSQTTTIKHSDNDTKEEDQEQANVQSPIEEYPEISSDLANNYAVQKSKKKSRKPLFWRIWSLSRPEWFLIIIGSLSSLIFGGIQPSFGLLFAKIYAQFADTDLNDQIANIRIYTVTVFCLGLLGGILQLISGTIFAKSGESLSMRLRLLSFEFLLRQKIRWFDHEEHAPGILMARLTGDPSAVKVCRIMDFRCDNSSKF
jgi:ABC-type multidrug transport system fused ATPase/permease subunit